MKYYILFTLFFLSSICCYSQQFTFSANGQYVRSQVNGDNLTGFRKSGYTIGISGGFEFNNNFSFFTTQNITSFGSIHHLSDFRSQKDYFIDLDFVSANILLGLKYTISKRVAVEGTKRKTRKNLSYFTIGPKIHQIIKSASKIHPANYGNQPYTSEDLNKRFLTVAASYGNYFGEHLSLEFSLEVGFTNLASKTEFENPVSPFFFAIGPRYQL